MQDRRSPTTTVRSEVLVGVVEIHHTLSQTCFGATIKHECVPLRFGVRVKRDMKHGVGRDQRGREQEACPREQFVILTSFGEREEGERVHVKSK